MKNLENIVKLLPLGALFLIICSSVKLIIYFDQFNIQIMEYAELDEVIVSFIDDMLYFTLVFGGSILMRLWLDNMPKSKLQTLTENLKKLNPSGKINLIPLCERISKIYGNTLLIADSKSLNSYEIVETLKTSINEFNSWYKSNFDDLKKITRSELSERKEALLNDISGFVEKLEEAQHMIEINFAIGNLKIKKRNLLILSVIFCLSIVVLLLIPTEYSLKFILLSIILFFSLMAAWNILQETKFQFNFYLVPVLGVVIYTICNAYSEAYSIKENSSKQLVVIKFKNETTLTTNKEEIYLGKTNKYVFFFNLKTKENKAYSANEITSIVSNKIK